MKKLRILLIFAFFIFSTAAIFGDSSCLRIHFLDVGEGEAILIETPRGETILIDGGNLVTGFKVVEYLKKNNIYNLDHLIFTHPDFDHAGGAFFILQALKAKNIYDNGQELVNTADIYRWYERLVRKDENYRVLKSKDIISCGTVILNVLWPPYPLAFSNFNANSIVIMLEYGKFRCLLTGDLTSEGEMRLLGQGINLQADVLKVGHHGASDASCEEFLKSIIPKIAIISVDSKNIRGYPDDLVIERFNKIGTKLYRTDKLGDIVLSIYQHKDKEYKIKINENDS